MMKSKISLLAFFSLIIFWGCENKSDAPDIQKELSETTAKFVQLPKGEANHYLLEKSIRNEKYKFEIQLYSEADTINDPQKILVFINGKNECRAIPLFSNTYRDYWGFKNEVPLAKIKKVQTTFSKEYVDALVALKLNNVDVAFCVTNDLLISILNCSKISACDFPNIQKMTFANNNYDLERESNYDYLKQKWKKNDDEILMTKNGIIDVKDVQANIGYLDFRNYRFLQVIVGEGIGNVFAKQQKVIMSEKDLKIKSYRKDQIINMMTL